MFPLARRYAKMDAFSGLQMTDHLKQIVRARLPFGPNMRIRLFERGFTAC
jgi:hypothetical protein